MGPAYAAYLLRLAPATRFAAYLYVLMHSALLCN